MTSQGSQGTTGRGSGGWQTAQDVEQLVSMVAGVAITLQTDRSSCTNIKRIGLPVSSVLLRHRHTVCLLLAVSGLLPQEQYHN